MKLLLAALAVTFAIAVVASVFAIWPAVADAPWEDAPAVVDDGTDVVRCDGALSLRASVIAAGEYSEGARVGGLPSLPTLRGEPLVGNPGGLRDYDAQLAKAEREIARYC